MQVKIPEELRADITEIEQIVQTETYSGHEMLKQQVDVANNYSILSLLLLISAKFSCYRYVELQQIAVGLELLNRGVSRHYQKEIGSLRESRIDNLSLIAGDYYYSKGISIASKLQISFIVEAMSQAIIQITEALTELDGVDTYTINEIITKYKPSLDKRASLHLTACKLGSFIGNVSEEMAKALEELGQSIGVLQQLNELKSKSAIYTDNHSDTIQSLVANAKGKLSVLPENTYSTFLEECIEEFACGT